ncbi:MAG: M20/M25/M40 family metallo-hydrolase [Bacteriovoracaceae bacterium]|nr:M20/M25/M40 family metallo-hydrolase [Bacteriovoracaceae bacterium]
MKLLEKLCQAAAIPGREQEVIDIMQKELKKTCHKVTIDDIGNVTALHRPYKKNAKNVLIAGHMDEIGFIVSYIDKSGFIRFSPRGGHIPKVLISQRVRIVGKKEIVGIVESTPAFLKRDEAKKASDIKDMYIDTGLSVKEVNKVIQVGDIIVLDRPFTMQGDVCISKAFDDRVGCYVVLETMKQLSKSKKLGKVNVYAVGTTQEEVGLRGAKGVAKDLIPDFTIAIDVTAAFDTPGVAEHQQVSKLGEGVAIKINDMGSISNDGIVQFMKKLAQKYKIKHQMEVLPFGATDAAGIQAFGSGAVCTLSVPARYVHSPNEMVNKLDVKATIGLLVKFIEECAACKLQF